MKNARAAVAGWAGSHSCAGIHGHRTADCAVAAKSPAVNRDRRRTGSASIYEQCTATYRGRACINIRAAERERSRAGLGQRAARAAHHAGKGRARVVAADGQIVRPQKYISAAFKRADGHAARVMTADIQNAVVGEGSRASPPVALPWKTISPTAEVTNCCGDPELVVMPAPVRINATALLTVIVKAGAELSNVIAPIVMVDEIKRLCMMDKLLNVAVSVVPELPG